jgi:hypothetical protein
MTTPALPESQRPAAGMSGRAVLITGKGADGEMRTLELDVLEYLVGPFMHRGAECPAAAAQRRSRYWLTSRPA